MSHALMMAQHPPCFVAAANKRPPSQPPRKSQRQKPATTTSNGFGAEKKSPVWQCVENCGACCKLDKGPTFPSAEEIFDDPSDIEMYKRLVGEDGWCIHYDKSSRKCSIYDVVVQILSKLCTEQIQKSWKSSTVQYGAAARNDGSC